MAEKTVWIKKTEAELMSDAAGEYTLSATKAKKLQKDYYKEMQAPRSEHLTPPYFLIADQLAVSDDQIFRAAVYNLGQVALAQPRYRKEILHILADYVDDKSKTPEQREYVKIKISEIKKAKNLVIASQ